jgi:hypothetical protein
LPTSSSFDEDERIDYEDELRGPADERERVEWKERRRRRRKKEEAALHHRACLQVRAF